MVADPEIITAPASPMNSAESCKYSVSAHFTTDPLHGIAATGGGHRRQRPSIACTVISSGKLLCHRQSSPPSSSACVLRRPPQPGTEARRARRRVLNANYLSPFWINLIEYVGCARIAPPWKRAALISSLICVKSRRIRR